MKGVHRVKQCQVNIKYNTRSKKEQERPDASAYQYKDEGTRANLYVQKSGPNEQFDVDDEEHNDLDDSCVSYVSQQNDNYRGNKRGAYNKRGLRGKTGTLLSLIVETELRAYEKLFKAKSRNARECLSTSA